MVSLFLYQDLKLALHMDSRFFALRNSDLSRLSVTNAFFATNLLLTFDRFTRKGCPQLVYTDRLKWPVAKQWEQTFVKGIV